MKHPLLISLLLLTLPLASLAAGNEEPNPLRSPHVRYAICGIQIEPTILDEPVQRVWLDNGVEGTLNFGERFTITKATMTDKCPPSVFCFLKRRDGSTASTVFARYHPLQGVYNDVAGIACYACAFDPSVAYLTKSVVRLQLVGGQTMHVTVLLDGDDVRGGHEFFGEMVDVAEAVVSNGPDRVVCTLHPFNVYDAVSADFTKEKPLRKRFDDAGAVSCIVPEEAPF